MAMNCPKCGIEISRFQAADAIALANLYSSSAVVFCVGNSGSCGNRVFVEEIRTYRITHTSFDTSDES